MSSTLTQQLVGDPVDPSSAPRPRRVTFEGRTISLVPLNAHEHLDSLWASTGGPQNEHLWTYMFEYPFHLRCGVESNRFRES